MTGRFEDREEKVLNPEECAERIRLVDEYSRFVTDYSVRLEALKRQNGERKEEEWKSAEKALAGSQRAWQVLEQHLSEHQCLALNWPSADSAPNRTNGLIMGQAAAAALDVILVADDDRRFVDLNEAAASLLGLPRSEIVGRRIDEFFSEASGRAIPAAWDSFISEGVQCGFCELKAPGPRRTFEYRAKANFASGLHLSVLRERPEAGGR